MQARGFRGYFVWPLGMEALWLSSPPLILLVVSLLSPIRPFDYFWALAQGRAILQLGRIPTENLFLYTLPVDAPFYNQPWLAELLLFGVERLSGSAGNVVLLGFLTALSVIVLMDTALRAGAAPRQVAFAALLVVPFIAQSSAVRTQMFALPCFALVLRYALLQSQPARPRALLWVLVVSALWANLHGTFVLAPFILGVRALQSFRSPRAALGELSLVVLATCINPRGPAVYAYVTRLGSAMGVGGRTDVTEWQALPLLEPTGLAFLLIALGGAALAFVYKGRVPAAGLLVVALLTVATLVSKRFLAWWALSVLATLPLLLGNWCVARDTKSLPGVNATLLGAAVVFVLASLPGGPVFERLAPNPEEATSAARVFGEETPLKTMRALEQEGYPGNIFHNQALGGLLEWTFGATSPKPVAFLDQRFELLPKGLWSDYFAISGARSDWQALLLHYGVGTLIIHEVEDARLVRALEHEPAWRLIHREFAYRTYVRAQGGY